MRSFILKLFFCASILSIDCGWLLAQDGGSLSSSEDEEKKKISFNGQGRATILQTGIGGNLLDTDTVTVESLTNGEFLLDLAINAQPNQSTEVQAVLRLRNEFGGFFGSGATVEVREIWARGVIANALKYRVGDMDLVMTPFTLYNSDEEGMVNEPEIFSAQKEIIYYEQFFTDNNTRRMQGAKLDFGLDITQGLKGVDFSAFIARLRGTDFFTLPSRLVGGGRVGFSTQTVDSLGFQVDGGINLVNTWDDLKSGEANDGIRNFVYSGDFDITIFDKENIGVHLIGEGGMSSVVEKIDEEKVFDKDDSFFEAEATVNLKPQNLSVSMGFVDVGPDFFSMGAQSKSIDYGRNKSYYNRTGNDRDIRMPTLFDIGRDRALYTFELSQSLMDYDPRYSNTQPYGKATPNRRGLTAGVGYAPKNNQVEVVVDAAFFKEIRGQGTFELKSFNLVRAKANVNLHEIIDWDRTLRFTLGYQYEKTSRDGDAIEQVDLSSNLIELGLEAELFSNFDFLIGAKLMSASGSDYLPQIDEFNIIRDFPNRYEIDDMESLIGAGFRYRFKEGIYLTGQYQHFGFSRETDSVNDYNMSQVFVIYSMDF